MMRLADSVRREVRAAGPGEWLVAALLVSAFYLAPVADGLPWAMSLVATCVAGAALVAWRPRTIRRLPLPIVAYTGVFALSGIVAGLGGGSDLARYLLRPAAIGALSLFLLSVESRRRAVLLLLALALPQVLVTAWQALDARLDYGSAAAVAADRVTGTFGDYGGGPGTLVALTGACLVVGLSLAGRLAGRWAAGLGVALLTVPIFTATRAAVVFIPVTAVALVAGAALILRRQVPARTISVVLAGAALAVPATYLGTEAIYPNAFVGVFNNQNSLFLGAGSPVDPADVRSGQGDRVTPGGSPAQPDPELLRGVAVLPGRLTQMKTAARISTEESPRVLLFGRGFGTAAVPEDATPATVVPEARQTGVTWIGKILTETGWLGLAAFLALLGWLAWLGIRIARAHATGVDRALGFALPGMAALTLAGAGYTTVLDVRPYSAAFIVLAAAGCAAARGPSADPTLGGNGRRALASIPLPPRQQVTSAHPSDRSARSS
jgi:hypothetical protein